MGTPFRIVLYAMDKPAADTAADAAFARIKQLNDILSDYDTDSELSRLSQTAGRGKAVKVGDDLWRVLERSQQVARETGGAFDVTCGPVVSLWRKARRERKLPDNEKLDEARRAVGHEKLKLNSRERTAELLVPYMRLDLGAIAKGYAVDEAMKILRSRGIRSALVSGGGDLAVSGAPPGTNGWRIELAPLDATNAPATGFVILNNAALATSGDIFQHVEINGTRYSHIVDPRTGIGLTDHSLVVVIAKDCMTADALSTSVSVLGPERGLPFAESHDACMRIVRKPSDKIEVRESKCFGNFVLR
ncbi:MAG TPA: FAD:protein FMN transferase [Verrucomicrobiae bacterium]|jgi:thiamine biosynthesis lipoprotein